MGYGWLLKRTCSLSFIRKLLQTWIGEDVVKFMRVGGQKSYTKTHTRIRTQHKAYILQKEEEKDGKESLVLHVSIHALLSR